MKFHVRAEMRGGSLDKLRSVAPPARERHGRPIDLPPFAYQIGSLLKVLLHGPRDMDPATCCRQGAIFRRVRSQLVENHADGEHPRTGYLEGDARAVKTPLPRLADRLAKQILKIRRLVAGGDFLRAQPRLQSSQQAIAVFACRTVPRLRLHGDGSDDREEVRHPVARLGYDEVLFGVPALALGDIVEDDENA